MIERYNFAFGQMPPNAEGWRDGALILRDNETGKEILRLRFDDAAALLMKAPGCAEKMGVLQP